MAKAKSANAANTPAVSDDDIISEAAKQAESPASAATQTEDGEEEDQGIKSEVGDRENGPNEGLRGPIKEEDKTGLTGPTLEDWQKAAEFHGKRADDAEKKIEELEARKATLEATELTKEEVAAWIERNGFIPFNNQCGEISLDFLEKLIDKFYKSLEEEEVAKEDPYLKSHGEGYVKAVKGNNEQVFTRTAWDLIGGMNNKEGWREKVATPPEVLNLQNKQHGEAS